MKALGQAMKRAAADSRQVPSERDMRNIDGGHRCPHTAAGKQLAQVYDSPRMRALHASIEAIRRQMEQAGQPMHALGEKMGALGQQMERASKAADQTVRALIRAARRQGLARPAPRAR